jgi:hypothetical protein
MDDGLKREVWQVLLPQLCQLRERMVHGGGSWCQREDETQTPRVCTDILQAGHRLECGLLRLRVRCRSAQDKREVVRGAAMLVQEPEHRIETRRRNEHRAGVGGRCNLCEPRVTG